MSRGEDRAVVVKSSLYITQDIERLVKKNTL